MAMAKYFEGQASPITGIGEENKKWTCFCDEYRRWNLESVKQLLPQNLILMISAMMIDPSGEEMDDSYWLHSSTDGSAKGQLGLAAAGGLIRDSSETWLTRFTYKIGISFSLTAELWAIYYGLMICWSKESVMTVFEMVRYHVTRVLGCLIVYCLGAHLWMAFFAITLNMSVTYQNPCNHLSRGEPLAPSDFNTY
ncbi:Mediator of RNA polymerase II transcription subunit 11 [Theobroma cacao]|uniref:Mediator of RNA polymerase II transcription subunit 11 n=1 Tax=Theobroma cacao TaxID=3641 RepID=A0A061FS90_THECC|nr:Mediator of RNA polymerase II transcription subunit 11 [Theobroma cacao]